MAIPLYTTGSLSPSFLPARPVGLAVKLPSAFALFGLCKSGWHRQQRRFCKEYGGNGKNQFDPALF